MNFVQRTIAWLLKPFFDALRIEIRAEVERDSSMYETQALSFKRDVEDAFGLLRREIDLAVKSSDLQLRKDIHAELKRVGTAMGEIQSRVPFTTQPPEDVTSLGERLTAVERVLLAATEPRKPGNHIGPRHEFGNKVNW